MVPAHFAFILFTLFTVNDRQMLHDPDVYPDPMRFDPTRHIATEGKEAQRDPRHACFGFGRRICPGLHLAEASVYLMVVMSLAVFDIHPVIENGVPVLPEHENTDGTIRKVMTVPYIDNVLISPTVIRKSTSMI